MTKPRFHSLPAGFTLVELLVAIAVLAIIVLVTDKMVGTTAVLTTVNNKHMDANDQARAVFDCLAYDFARIVKRKDVDYIFWKNTPSNTAGTNDAMYFYTEGGSYFDNSIFASITGFPYRELEKSAVSLVGYRVNNIPAVKYPSGTNPDYYQMERLGKALSWDAAAYNSSEAGITAGNNSNQPNTMVLLTYPPPGDDLITGASVSGNTSYSDPTSVPYSTAFFNSTLAGAYSNNSSDSFGLLPSAVGTYPGGTAVTTTFNDSMDTSYRSVGSQVFRFEYCFQLKDGTMSDKPMMVHSATNGIPSSYLSMVTNGTLILNTGSTTLSPGADNPPGTISNTGVGAWIQEPVIWNPHDPSSSPGVAGPTSFRVLADSATPDQALLGPASGVYNYFFVYGKSGGASSYSNTTTNLPATYTGSTGSFLYSGVGAPASGSDIPQQITATNSEIDFTVTTVATPAAELCPEPVVSMRSQFFDNTGTLTSRANQITVTVPVNNLMLKDPAVSTAASSAGLKSAVANAPNITSPASASNDPIGTRYIGFYLGAFPMFWKSLSGNVYSVTSSSNSSGVWLVRSGASGSPPGYGTSCYMTYRMQYKDASGNWITYDTKYGQAYGSGHGGNGKLNGNPGLFNLLGESDWCFATDPRTSRFGLLWNGGLESYNKYNYNVTPAPDDLDNSGYEAEPLPYNRESTSARASHWLDILNGIIYTVRPDADAGYYAKACFSNIGAAWKSSSSGWMANVSSGTSTYSGLAPGLLAQNNTDIYYFPYRFYGDGQGNSIQTPNYFADPDGMVRRAMGAYVPGGASQSVPPEGAPISAATTVGLPMARVFNWNAANITVPSTPDPTIKTYPSTMTPPTTAAPTSQGQSRPYFLHRPFYSVAELGYVFSDTPWRNLDFFTAESGNAALLDTFCINDTNDPGGLVAGKVNLNTRQAPVLKAILAGGCVDPGFQQPLNGSGPVGQLDATTAGLVASALVARTTDTANIGNGTGPLQNVSELVGKYVGKTAINDLAPGITLGVDKGTLDNTKGFYDGKLSYAGFSGGVWDTTNHQPLKTSPAEDVYSAYMNSGSFSTNVNLNGTQQSVGYIQRFREAPIRALAASGTTRVWNLMIDVIAQTGRFPSSASSLANFNVEGERRYWVHVAIDRYTGKVLDEQVEEVKE